MLGQRLLLRDCSVSKLLVTRCAAAMSSDSIPIIPGTNIPNAFWGKYEYEDVCSETGIKPPHGTGRFVVRRPHATFRIPSHYVVKEDPFPILETVCMDEGDVLISSVMKTGLHLNFAILHMLRTGKAEYQTVKYNDRWLDMVTYDRIMKAQTRPRVMHTHLPLSKLPPNFRRSDTKVIIPMRNLKDMFVSFYHHLNAAMKVKTEPQPWSDYFNFLLHCPTVDFGNPFDWYADLWDNHRNDPNVFIVQYELLITHPEQIIKQMADHVRIKATPEFIKQVAEASRFKNLKSAAYDEEKKWRDFYKNDFTIYRKGEIGDWRNYFTMAQNEQFHHKFDTWNKNRQIPMIFDKHQAEL